MPISFRRRVFENLHSLAHPGTCPSKRLIAARYVWPGLNKDVTSWARSCLSCQQSKISQHVASPLQSFPVPSSRFQHLHVDIVVPLPPLRGDTYLFTIIDRFTHWPEEIPMADCIAVTCAQAFLSGWIACFGVPASITSDRGCQFISELWKDLLHSLGIKPTHTASYHPQANVLVERMHWQLKTSIKQGSPHHPGILSFPSSSWACVLPSRKISALPLLRWSMALLSIFLEISLITHHQ